MSKKRSSEGGDEPSSKKTKVEAAPAGPAAPPVVVFSAANPPVSQDDVVLWASQIGLDQEDANKLKNPNKLDGAHLADIAKDDKNDIMIFFSNVCGVSGAAARDLALALPSLFPGARPGQFELENDGEGGWKVEATVQSVRNPALSFQCDFVIDTGNRAGPISLPKKKVQELQLNVVRTQPCTTAGGPGVVKFYDPVRITLTDDNGQTYSFDFNPFVTPHGDQIYPDAAPGGVVAPMPAQHGAVFPISPVKVPIPANRKGIHDEPLMGAAFLRGAGLRLDTKGNCLYSVIGHV